MNTNNYFTNDKGHIEIHARANEVLREGFYFPVGLALLMKVFAHGQCTLLSTYHFLPHS